MAHRGITARAMIHDHSMASSRMHMQKFNIFTQHQLETTTYLQHRPPSGYCLLPSRKLLTRFLLLYLTYNDLFTNISKVKTIVCKNIHFFRKNSFQNFSKYLTKKWSKKTNSNPSKKYQKVYE